MTRFLVKIVKYWYLYLIPLLLIPTAATLYGMRKVTEYQATSTIYVQTNPYLKDLQSQDENAFATKAQNISDQMSQLLQSESFLVSVADGTSLKTVYDLKSTAGQDAAAARIGGNVTVGANNTRNIVFVTAADHTSPQVAKELAGAVVAQFVAFYAKKEVDTLTAVKDFYDKQYAENSAKLTADSNSLNDYQKQHPEVQTLIGQNDPRYVQLKNQVDTDRATLTSTLASQGEVQMAMDAAKSGQSYAVTPLDSPTLPKTATVNASKLLVYPIGALVGVLALLAIIAAIQTKLDRRVYDREDIMGILDRLEWDLSTIEIMPIISMDGGSGSIKWEDRENSPVPAMLTPVLASLPRPGRKQLRSGTTQGPRRERRSEPAGEGSVAAGEA